MYKTWERGGFIYSLNYLVKKYEGEEFFLDDFCPTIYYVCLQCSIYCSNNCCNNNNNNDTREKSMY